jgi:hypothetical protein
LLAPQVGDGNLHLIESPNHGPKGPPFGVPPSGQLPIRTARGRPVGGFVANEFAHRRDRECFRPLRVVMTFSVLPLASMMTPIRRLNKPIVSWLDDHSSRTARLTIFSALRAACRPLPDGSEKTKPQCEGGFDRTRYPAIVQRRPPPVRHEAFRPRMSAGSMMRSSGRSGASMSAVGAKGDIGRIVLHVAE